MARFSPLGFHACCHAGGAIRLGAEGDQTEVPDGCTTCYSCSCSGSVNFRSGGVTLTERLLSEGWSYWRAIGPALITTGSL